MCDYSLHLVASRPARVGDQLVVTNFESTMTRGFATYEEPNVAVCLLPGTELSFESKVQYDRIIPLFGKVSTHYSVARFRQVNMHRPDVHHDALEFPDAQIVMVTRLTTGQRAIVLQLPVSARDRDRVEVGAQRKLWPIEA
jgi:hypothetical protein